MKHYDDLVGAIFTGVFLANLVSAQVVGLSWLTMGETVAIIAISIAIRVLVSLALGNIRKEKEDEQ